MAAASPPTCRYTASPDELAQLLAWLESKGRVVLDNEVYKVATGGASKSPAPAAATVSSGPYELENNAAVLSALGFPTAEGTFGFTPFVEVLHGRLAMAGIVGSVARELNTDMGTLEQLGVEGLPSIGGCSSWVGGGSACRQAAVASHVL
jgi:hypothetical protein